MIDTDAARNIVRSSSHPKYFINEQLGYKLNDDHERMLNRLLAHRMQILCEEPRTGKTTVGLSVALWTAIFRPDRVCAVISPPGQSDINRDTVVDEIAKLTDEFRVNVDVYKDYIQFPNGSRIYFFSCANAVQRLRGRNISYLYVDEFTSWVESEQRALFDRIYPTVVSGPEGSMLITITPLFVPFWVELMISNPNAHGNILAKRLA